MSGDKRGARPERNRLIGIMLLGLALSPASAQESPMDPGIRAPVARPAPAALRAEPRRAPASPRPNAPAPHVPTPAEIEARKLGPPPPYEKPLVELAETMGSLAFLGDLCGPVHDPNPWRKRIEALVEAEGEVIATRERMMGAYNLGFSAYRTTYRTCTDAARAARLLLTREAARIARTITRRYGS